MPLGITASSSEPETEIRAAPSQASGPRGRQGIPDYARVQQVLESETCGPTAPFSSMPWGGVQNLGEQGIAQHPQGAGWAQPSFHQYQTGMFRHLCQGLPAGVPLTIHR